MPRNFLVQPGRSVTLPQGLVAGPGQTNMRLDEGALVTLDDAACNGPFSRFINNRTRHEDWKEVDAPPEKVTPTQFVPDPYKPASGPQSITTGAPEKKER
jgi:hypothetical protein